MKLVAFDVETAGTEDMYALQPFRALTDEAWVTMAAFASNAGVTGVVFATESDPLSRRVKSVKVLKEWLDKIRSKGATICGWNVPFDMAWLIALGLREEVYACKWLDGMALWRHLTASPEWTGLAPRSYGLKAAVAEFIPEEAGYGDGIVFDMDFTNPEAVDLLLEYNKKDAAFTLRLVEGFLERLSPEQKRMALIEAACLPMVAESYVEGIRANRAKAEALAEKLSDKAKLAFVKLKLNGGENIDESVLASPTKLRKLLHEDWGLPVVKVTEKGASSTDRDALSQLAPLDERAALLNEYRESNNNRTKFALGTVNSLDYNGDGCVRPTAKVYGTYTGRMTYGSKVGKGKSERPTGVALHQWKRDPEFRDVIEGPEGYELMEFDFAGQEFRWMAVLSGDPTMLQLCQPGEDAHGYMGAKIAGWSYEDIRRRLAEKDKDAKDKRQLGKVANLSLQYRTSANTLIRVARTGYQMNLAATQAKAIHATYRTAYPRVQWYWEKQIKQAAHNGWVSTIAGRRVHVGMRDTWKRPGAYDDAGIIKFYEDNTWGCESTAINFPIQGSGADQKYLALMVLKNYLPKVGGRFYFELHDGLFVVIPKQHADRAAHEIKALLSNLPYKRAWGVDLPIAFPVDGKRGPTWGQLKEFE